MGDGSGVGVFDGVLVGVFVKVGVLVGLAVAVNVGDGVGELGICVSVQAANSKASIAHKINEDEGRLILLVNCLYKSRMPIALSSSVA